VYERIIDALAASPGSTNRSPPEIGARGGTANPASPAGASAS
jgi:hypothetical protein